MMAALSLARSMLALLVVPLLTALPHLVAVMTMTTPIQTPILALPCVTARLPPLLDESVFWVATTFEQCLVCGVQLTQRQPHQ